LVKTQVKSVEVEIVKLSVDSPGHFSVRFDAIGVDPKKIPDSLVIVDGADRLEFNLSKEVEVEALYDHPTEGRITLFKN
jgi:hypothetical protein